MLRKDLAALVVEVPLHHPVVSLAKTALLESLLIEQLVENQN